MERGVVVAGYHGYGDAGLATLWAAAEAASQGHSLIILHAAGWSSLPEPSQPPPPAWPTPLSKTAVDPTALEHAQTQLAAMAEQCRRLWPSLIVHTRIVFGQPAEALCHAAADAYLLVVGPPAPPEPPRTLLNTMATRLINRCDRPIVVVRHVGGHGHLRIPSVVVGIDGSSTSARATHFAYDYAARHGYELVAVHAWPNPPEETPAPQGDVHRDWHSEWEHAEQLLTRFLASYRPRYPNVRVRQVATRDRPTRALRKHASGASLLVLGRHRSTLRLTAHHSISNPLIYHPPCPVAIIH